VSGERLRVVGVAMDDEEDRLNRFLDMHTVPGQQVFFPDAEQRSWNSPIVTWWGLARCPSMWLVDVTENAGCRSAETGPLKSVQAARS